MSRSRSRGCPPVRSSRFPVPGEPRAALLRWPGLAPGARRRPLPGGTRVPPEVRLPCLHAAATNSVFERTMSRSLLIDGIQDQPHRAGERLPLGLLGGKLSPPPSREAIVLGTLTSIGQIPGCSDPAFRLQPVECRVKRTG